MKIEPTEWLPSGLSGDSEHYRGNPRGPAELLRRLRETTAPRETPFDRDSEDLRQAGWAILKSEDEDPSLLQAIAPLVDFRRSQAGKLFREIEYRGQDSRRFQIGLGLDPGPADPARFPYYLLILGGPEKIPFELQFDLALQRAVGRVDLEKAALERYVKNVLAEEAAPPPAAGVSFFGVQNDDDPLTVSSLANLVEPLAQSIRDRSKAEVQTILGGKATRERFRELLANPPHPLLFTASHSLRFPPGHRRQQDEQGALVCADWPGPQKWPRAIPSEFVFSAADMEASSGPQGLIAFLFACYSHGTPERDLFDRGNAPSLLAPAPFISGLSKGLLAHPAGGALAVVGHVDQTFEPGFKWPGAGARIETFSSVFLALLGGWRLGHAMEYFSRRYARISAEIAGRLFRKPEAEMSVQDRDDLALLWQAFQDARSFGILGDPAVRLGGSSTPELVP